MIPGLGFFYAGLLRRKNALSMIFTSVACIAVVSFQVWILPVTSNFSVLTFVLDKWFFWGYSLAFSETASKYIGDLGMLSLTLSPYSA
jgi:Amt family ammonium transporter